MEKEGIKRASDTLKDLWEDEAFREDHALRNAARACEGSYGTITEFDGVVYKSKVEADFASLLKDLGLEYEYDPFAITLETGNCYVPDFYLKELKLLVEVKWGSYDIDEEKMMYVELAGWDIEVVTRRTFKDFEDRYASSQA